MNPMWPKRAWLAATGALLLVVLPAFREAALLASHDARLAGDTGTHLAIAQDLARAGIPHGWVATYNGGFPIAIHYPCVGWIVTALLLRAGMHPVLAIQSVGFVAVVAAPLTFFFF